MKSTRKILFAALFMVLTLVLVACGGSKSYLADTIKTVEANIPTSLNDGDTFSITNPNPDHVTITWESSDEEIIAADGKVTALATEEVVSIDVTFTEGKKKENKSYDVTVNAKAVTDTTLADAKAALTVVGQTSTDLVLPSKNGEVTITWVSDNAAITAAGKVTRGDADVTVKLTATLTYKGKSDTKVFTVKVLAKEVVDTTLADAKAALTLDVTETEEDLTLPQALGEVVITWTSSNAAITAAGKVTRGEDDILVELTATLSYKGQTDTKTFTVKVLALPDTKAPVLVGLTPTTGNVVVDLNKNFVLTVQAQDKNLYSLEVDHSLEGTIPEFTVYADASNPYGDDTQKVKFEQAGASVSYDASTQTWTLDFGQTLTEVIIANEGITFYLVVADSEGNEFGSMSPTAPENTFVYSVEREVDADAPTNVEVTTPGAIPLAPNASFVWTVKASDKYLYSLEIDHSFQGTLPEFTVYANAGNPYGDDTQKAKFEQAGVSVSYDASTQTWTLDFGKDVTDIFKVNGVTFYIVIKDTTGNVFGSMSPTTPENTFAYTFTGLPQLPNIVNGFGGYSGLDKGSFAMGPYNPANISAESFLGFEYIFKNTTDDTEYRYFLSAQFNTGVAPIVLGELNLGLTPGNYDVSVVARGNGVTYIDSEPYTNGNGKFEIPFPEIEEDVQLSQNDLVLSWSEVDGLTYVLTVNGTVVTFEGNTYTLSGYGTHNVKLVVSKVGYKDLVIEEEYVITNPNAGQLDTPTNLVISDEKVLTWDEVANVSSYIVTIGSLNPITVEEETLDLKSLSIPVGTHHITIVAKGDGDVFLNSEASDAVEYTVVLEDLPKLTTPLHGMGHTPNIFHLGIGPYDREDTKAGYAGKLRIVFTHKTTGTVVEVEINAGFGAGSAYVYKDLNLPAGDYEVKFQAVGNQTTHQDSDFHPGIVTVTIEKPKLDTFTLSLNDLIVTWSAVSNATSYELFIDEVSQGSIEGLSYTIDPVALNLEFGLHTIKVVAKADGYQDSTATTTYEYVNDEAQPLATPEITLLDGVITWTAIDGAQSYSILVNGTFKQTVASTELTYTLSQLELNQGTYDITLIAKGNGVDNLDSLPSNTVSYESSQLAPQLNPAVTGNFGGNLFNGYGNGHYAYLPHAAGQAPLEQEGFSGKFLIEVRTIEGILINTSKDKYEYGLGENFIQRPGTLSGKEGFLEESNLTKGTQYQIYLYLIANEGYRNSEPLKVTFTW